MISKVSAPAVLFGGVVALASVTGAHAQSALQADNPIDGAIDFHVHSAPDAVARNISDIAVAGLASHRGMRGIVLKNHLTQTADRAALVAEAVPGIEVFGGVVLNHAVGGLNSAAIDAMANMSGGKGKVVWLPTRDAQYNIDMFGGEGEGIRVTENGEVTPEVAEVLERVRDLDLVLHTGHVSPEETLLVIRKARKIGIERIAVTHAMADVPGLSIEQMSEAAAHGAYLELVFLSHLMGPDAHLEWMQHWGKVSIADMANAIKEVGAEHFLLASDLGQTGNPIHPDGYEMLVRGLKAQGIPGKDVQRMMADNPAKLLGLDGVD